ncbi:hypothetical protein ABGB14_35780 [Nonomuraea sp. B10E15]|uniref:hypothetical protein n=1 Tax=unclassified Nonomuraea TaxID=2593643 RepID=UPI00325F3387
MSVRVWFLLPVVVAATAGCSAANPRSLEKIALDPGAAGRRIVLPFDTYDLSPAEIMTLESAEELLVRDCMRQRGRAWELLPRTAEADISPPHRRRYGIIEPLDAERFGYHMPPDGRTLADRKAKRAVRRQSLSSEDLRAADRCLEKAGDRLARGAPKVDAGLFNRLIFKTFDTSQREADVVHAFRAWSTCMATAGFRYTDPLTAISDERWATQRPSPREIHAAKADVRCKTETALVSTWAAAENRVQHAAIRAHAKEFQALKASKDRQLEAASHAVARG